MSAVKVTVSIKFQRDVSLYSSCWTFRRVSVPLPSEVDMMYVKTNYKLTKGGVCSPIKGHHSKFWLKLILVEIGLGARMETRQNKHRQAQRVEEKISVIVASRRKKFA